MLPRICPQVPGHRALHFVKELFNSKNRDLFHDSQSVKWSSFCHPPRLLFCFLLHLNLVFLFLLIFLDILQQKANIIPSHMPQENISINHQQLPNPQTPLPLLTNNVSEIVTQTFNMSKPITPPI
jgi:hypothetical protein